MKTLYSYSIYIYVLTYTDLMAPHCFSGNTDALNALNDKIVYETVFIELLIINILLRTHMGIILSLLSCFGVMSCYHRHYIVRIKHENALIT